MKSAQLVMLMALLFCVFLCPHSADARNVDSICESGIECLDLCENHGHEHHHECELDGSHSHQYRNDTSSLVEYVHIRWVCLTLLIGEPNQNYSFHYSDHMADRSSHTYAVRHLDKIILRV
jgi:hypothetical protein